MDNSALLQTNLTSYVAREIDNVQKMPNPWILMEEKLKLSEHETVNTNLLVGIFLRIESCLSDVDGKKSGLGMR